MKIGIITFYNTEDNYGQLLQCYALQEYLRKNGHTPFLIRYKSSGGVVTSSSFINRTIKTLWNLRAYINYRINKKRTDRYNKTAKNNLREFDVFREEHIVSTEQVYTEAELNLTPPQAEAYICGSDQIWGGDFAYYLNFAPANLRRIAYAASFGGVKSFEPSYEKELKSLLAKFHFLGLREESGVRTCQRLGRGDAVKVVDPTLLLDSLDYDRLRTTRPAVKKYIFVYLLGNPTNLRTKEVYKWAKAHGCEVRYVASQGQYDKYPKCYDTIGEWIDDIANAELVITNSFHCNVFSLLYEKPFVTVPLVGAYSRMNTRVEELLATCGLQHRKYNGSIEDVYQSNISFDGFRMYKEQEVRRSLELLLNAIS